MAARLGACPGSPAAAAGVKDGERLRRLLREVETAAEVYGGAKVSMGRRRLSAEGIQTAICNGVGSMRRQERSSFARILRFVIHAPHFG